MKLLLIAVLAVSLSQSFQLRCATTHHHRPSFATHAFNKSKLPTTAPAATGGSFYSSKSLSSTDFLHSPASLNLLKSIAKQVEITKPSRIQAAAWPAILEESRAMKETKSDSAIIVADQTGSGKTLAFLVPLIQRLADNSSNGDNGGDAKSAAENGISPQIVIIAPTSELVNQIGKICKGLANIAKFKVKPRARSE